MAAHRRKLPEAVSVTLMPADLDAAAGRVTAFLRRAERIMATPAAQRADLATIGTTMRLLASPVQGQHRIERSHLPQSELLEVAVLLRPVFAEGDDVFIGKVTTALGLLTRGGPQEFKQPVGELKKAWTALVKGWRWKVMVADAPTATDLTDVQIAELWFNAHVWHSDMAKAWQLRHISDDEALICATVWVMDRVRLVRAAQQLIVDLRRVGGMRS